MSQNKRYFGQCYQYRCLPILNHFSLPLPHCLFHVSPSLSLLLSLPHCLFYSLFFIVCLTISVSLRGTSSIRFDLKTNRYFNRFKLPSIQQKCLNNPTPSPYVRGVGFEGGGGGRGVGSFERKFDTFQLSNCGQEFSISPAQTRHSSL